MWKAVNIYRTYTNDLANSVRTVHYSSVGIARVEIT